MESAEETHPIIDEEMKLWARCEELKRHISVQRVQDQVLTERLQQTEKEKLKTQTKLAEMTLDGERLACKLRSKEKEMAMLESHRAKLETCVQMLTAGDPSKEALLEERAKLEDLAKSAAKFVDQMQQSPWIPEMEKMRKSLESDMQRLQKAKEEKRRLEEIVSQAKDRVNFHLENLFIPLVLKLAKYRWQRNEMVRSYAEELKKHIEIEKRKQLELLDNAMMEVSENADEAHPSPADSPLDAVDDEAMIVDEPEKPQEADEPLQMEPEQMEPLDESMAESDAPSEKHPSPIRTNPVSENMVVTGADSASQDSGIFNGLFEQCVFPEAEFNDVFGANQFNASASFNAFADFNASTEFNASTDFNLPEWMTSGGTPGEDNDGKTNFDLDLSQSSFGFGFDDGSENDKKAEKKRDK